MGNLFGLGHFERSALNDPNMNLNTTSRRYLIHVLQVLMSPKFKFCSMTNHFGVGGHFDTSALNDLEWPWTINQKYPIYVLLVSLNPEFQSVFLYEQLFWKYSPFWEKSPKLPHMTLNATRLWSWTLQGHTLYALLVLVSPESQISHCDQPFLSYKPFWDKCIEWSQNDHDVLEHYKAKGSPYVPTFPESHISLRFTLRPDIFELQAYTGSRYPYVCYQVLESQISPIFLCSQPFQYTRK